MRKISVFLTIIPLFFFSVIKAEEFLPEHKMSRKLKNPTVEQIIANALFREYLHKKKLMTQTILWATLLENIKEKEKRTGKIDPKYFEVLNSMKSKDDHFISPDLSVHRRCSEFFDSIANTFSHPDHYDLQQECIKFNWFPALTR